MIKLGITMLIIALISLTLLATYYVHARLSAIFGNYLTLRKQRLRRSWWRNQREHYQRLYYLQLNAQKLPLMPLRTTLRLPRGELAYLMLSPLYLIDLDLSTPDPSQRLLACSVLDQDSSPVTAKAHKNYLFVTNMRLLIMQNQQELSLYYPQLRQITASLYCLELFTKSNQRYVIFHNKSYALVNAYCHLRHFAAAQGVECHQYFA